MVKLACRKSLTTDCLGSGRKSPWGWTRYRPRYVTFDNGSKSADPPFPWVSQPIKDLGLLPGVVALAVRQSSLGHNARSP